MISTSTNLADAASAFSSNTGRFHYLANLPNVPLSAPITWEWQRVQGNSTRDLFPPLTFAYRTVIRYSFADGPH